METPSDSPSYSDFVREMPVEFRDVGIAIDIGGVDSDLQQGLLTKVCDFLMAAPLHAETNPTVLLAQQVVRQLGMAGIEQVQSRMDAQLDELEAKLSPDRQTDLAKTRILHGVLKEVHAGWCREIPVVVSIPQVVKAVQKMDSGAGVKRSEIQESLHLKRNKVVSLLASCVREGLLESTEARNGGTIRYRLPCEAGEAQSTQGGSDGDSSSVNPSQSEEQPE